MNLRIWILAARPKTWVATFSPILIGLTIALQAGAFHGWIALLTLLTALGIQVGTNFCNDVCDYLKGADTSLRKGPTRAVQAGLISTTKMKGACMSIFIFSALSGSALIYLEREAIAIPAIAGLLALSITLGIAYTAGPRPLAYLGLGEPFVFLFFGPLATAGTYYLQTASLSLTALLAGIAPGLFSTALLVVNNVRDIEEDRAASKKTLPARFGAKFGLWEYGMLLVLAELSTLPLLVQHPPLTLCLLPLPLLYFLLQKMRHSRWQELLGNTGQLLWLHTLLWCIGWLL